MNDVNMNSYECVEPEVGDQIWRYGLPDIDSETRGLLGDHLKMCDRCRLAQALEREAEAGLQAGRLTVAAASLPNARPSRSKRWTRLDKGTGLAAASLMAATLAFVLLLPHGALERSLPTRGEGGAPGFHHPAEGEVVLGSRPQLSWQPVDGARSYRVTVNSTDGSFSWEGVTEDTEIVLPAGVTVPAATSLRAELHTVPADLLPLEGISVEFRTSTLPGFLGHRFKVAPGWVFLPGALGVLLMGFVALRSRRSELAVI